ncbi:MFS transporter [Streptomyces sp. NPDC048737]|uniref:MFS transporter n=1 Tax=unclassified Streptomyces TaxID=2593676 RepID=UPI0034282B24
MASSEERVATYGQLLRNREFSGLFAAHTVSILGDVLTKVALSVLIYNRTDSALLTALTYAFGFLPQILTAALASAVVDLVPARRLMLIGDLGRLVCVLAMTVPGMPVPVLLLLVAVSGALSPLFRAVRQVLLPEIVGMNGYALGRSMFSGTVQIGQTLGFGLGGMLLVVFTPRTALLIDAATFAFSIAAVALLVRPRPAAAAGRLAHPSGIVRATVRGNRSILGDSELRRLLLLQWVPTAFVVLPEGLAAPYAAHLGGGPEAVGLLLAFPAVGTVIGEAVVARFLGPQVRTRWVPALVLVAVIPLLFFAFTPSLPMALALLFVSGVGTAFALPLDQLFIERVPTSLRGRAMTLTGAGSIAAQGAGLALGGVMADWMPMHWVFAGAGTAALTAAVVTGRKRPWRPARTLPMPEPDLETTGSKVPSCPHQPTPSAER